MPAPSKPSFAARALLALALLFGFYALGLLVIAVCVGSVWLQLEAGHLFGKLILIALVIAGTVAYAMLRTLVFASPAFEPPGPEIDEAAEPELFALIREVADRMQTSMPAAIYLIPDVNAFVTEHGGFLGFGTRRVMGVGVGLLQVDTVQQLKATIAHEFGHYAGGDTKLGGFLYRTRAALVRVISTLGDGVVASIFTAYFKMYLRVTHAMSRAQELAADEASVRIAGTKAHIDGLRREARGGILFHTFMRSEVSPIVHAGFRPARLFGGFRRAAKELHRSGARKSIDAMLESAETDPYDTHPALPERIAYAESLPRVEVPSDDRLARELLRNAAEVEQRIGEDFLGALTDGAKLEEITWKESGGLVFGPLLAKEAETLRAKLEKAGMAASTYDEALASAVEVMGTKGIIDWVRKMFADIDELPMLERSEAAEERVVRIAALFAGALIVEKGGEWVNVPGRSLDVAIGEVSYPVFDWARAAMGSKGERAALLDRVRNVQSAGEPASEA